MWKEEGESEIMVEEKKKRSLQHLLFPGGHPSKCWAGPTLLNSILEKSKEELKMKAYNICSSHVVTHPNAV